MKREDAPPEGWYPDPSGGTRLRWWDGMDWTDSWRSPGQHVGAEIAEAAAAAGERAAQGGGTAGAAGAAGAAAAAAGQVQELAGQGAGRRDQELLLADMRRIARAEVDRVTGDIGRRAKEATTGLETTVKNVVDEYGPQAMRWLRRGVVAIVIGWIVFNILQAASGAAQMTLFEWFGERLDAWTSTITLAVLVPVPERVSRRLGQGLLSRSPRVMPAPGAPGPGPTRGVAVPGGSVAARRTTPSRSTCR